MDSEILINVTGGETRVALLEGGQVVEFYVERRRDASLVGNIYKGKIVKILPGMQSAFVDIGFEKAAFLYVADIKADTDEYAPLFEDEEKDNSIELIPRRSRSEMTIEDIIQEGQEILVQVSKDPIGSKGARVTSYITLPGRYLVLMPDVDHIGISRRISNEEERNYRRGHQERPRVSPPSMGKHSGEEGTGARAGASLQRPRPGVQERPGPPEPGCGAADNRFN
jgi:ribonuclease G